MAADFYDPRDPVPVRYKRVSNGARSRVLDVNPTDLDFDPDADYLRPNAGKALRQKITSMSEDVRRLAVAPDRCGRAVTGHCPTVP
jgi:hypothetical protein